ncbi:MAG TPA: cytochrome P450 [Ktedonosporobacter sp.]|nr:cytochrome P450 [Ktedonosporobacter sp.]
MTTKTQEQITTTTTVTPTRKTLSYISGFPLVGNLPEFMKDRLNFMLRMANTGEACGMHFGPFPVILFNKPEHVQSIFVEHGYDFDRGAGFHDTLPSLIGENIFSHEGEVHRNQRRRMTPPFQPRHIISYATTMGYYGEHIQQTWPDGATIDIYQQMRSLTMSIAGKTLFNTDVFSETDQLGAGMLTVLGHISYILSTLFPLPYNWPFLPRNRRTYKALPVVRTHLQHFIDERRAALARSEGADCGSDLLSILLQARDEDGHPMSDEQLVAECIALFGAGYETVATVLAWIWCLLCQHPQCYQKVQQEVDSVLQGRTPTYSDLAQLPYCLQVFKETMRLYPPIPAISRRALCDIEIDGYPVPKGQVVLVSPYALHRQERYFPHPEQFEPEHFAPEREKQLPRYVYMPFGAGPRICIGNHFAMLMGHLLLATLAQRVSFSLVPGQTIKPTLVNSMTWRPEGIVRMTIRKR